MICCQALIEEFLDDYLERRLTETSRQMFEEHLVLCPPCRAYLDSFRSTVRAIQSCREKSDRQACPEPPEELIRGILAMVCPPPDGDFAAGRES